MKIWSLLFLLFHFISFAQPDHYILIKADRLFDGEAMHTSWSLLIKDNRIAEVGIINNYPANTQLFNLGNATILPGFIEGHSHLFLHPYNEVSWNDQVLKESRAERTARAVNHAKATLLAGFTTVRDLGTEGVLYDDVGLKTAIQKGVIPGPRMIVATRAIVAKGTYGPKSENPDVSYPQGAAEVAGLENMADEVRTQISKGADLIKLYTDYRWGLNGQAAPTFSIEEIALAVSIAKSSGREVVAHASTVEGMRRAVLGGVSTIEHGNDGTAEIFKLMKEKKVAFCPTLAASEAIAQYSGWKKETDPEPTGITNKKKSFSIALQSGVTILMGGDVGVFAHGENWREMELMAAYGMKPIDVLRSATAVNADAFGYGDKIGQLKQGFYADVIAVDNDPSANIQNIEKMKLVIKDGIIYKAPQ